MEADKDIAAARDKIVNRAGAWLARRKAKAGLSGVELKTAQDKQKDAENDLAEATEKYQKSIIRNQNTASRADHNN